MNTQRDKVQFGTVHTGSHGSLCCARWVRVCLAKHAATVTEVLLAELSVAHDARLGVDSVLETQVQAMRSKLPTAALLRTMCLSGVA